MPKKVSLSRMIGKTGDVAFDLSGLHFSEFKSTEGWKPDVNVFHYDDRIEMWVDLAGVEKDEIRVDVFPDRIRISGERKTPFPRCTPENKCRRVIMMEIESGRFAREIKLPVEIDQTLVTAEQTNGILSIVLPFS